MIGAIVKNNLVENIIVINESQIEEMQTALNCEIVDAAPYGLCVGDLRTQAGWTRNAGGEQMILPLLEGESYDSYTILSEKVVGLEEQIQVTSEETTNEALAILHGEVEE